MKNSKIEEEIFLKIFRKNFNRLSSSTGLCGLFSHNSRGFYMDRALPHNVDITRISVEKGIVNKEYYGVDIKYTLNDRGYRAYPDLNKKSKKRIFCFGCSYTFGLGIPDDHTWPYQLGKLIGGDCYVYNFGVSGSSVGFSAMLFLKIMNSIKKEEYPDAVFFLFPDPFRYCYFGNSEEEIFSNHQNMGYFINKTYDDHKKNTTDEAKINKYAHDSVIESFLKFVKYFNMIKETAKNKEISWYWYTWNPFYYKIEKNILEKYVDIYNTKTDEFGIVPINFLGFSSDGTHWNGKTNEQASNSFYKLYNECQGIL